MKTDKQLKQEVEEELDYDPAINVADIGVEVKDKIVTLFGHPTSYAEKIADAHIDRHAHAADGAMQDDAGTMQFDMADRSVGAGVMRLETNRK